MELATRQQHIGCSCLGLQVLTIEQCEVPIEFDDTLQQVQLCWKSDDAIQYARIDYCIFCGSLAPRTLPPTSFHTLSFSERCRISQVLRLRPTVEEVIKGFGEPNEHKITPYRTLSFRNCSNTAIVRVDISTDGLVGAYTLLAKRRTDTDTSHSHPRPIANAEWKGGCPAVLCHCSWLQEMAERAEVPVVFDAELNEFNIVWGGGRGLTRIIHCPRCGGATPRTNRETYFKPANIEQQALISRVSQLSKIKGIIDTIGQPDSDLITTGRERRSPDGRTEAYFLRTLRYCRLSRVFDLHIVVSPDGRIVGFDATKKAQ